jgi:hypothetical protein
MVGQPKHAAWMSFDKTVGRYIAIHSGHTSNHGHASDMNELMNTEAPTDDSPVFNQHMSCNLDAIGHHDVVPKPAVMTKMAVRHQQVVIAYPGLLSLVGGAINSDAFTNGVVVTNHNLRWRSFVFQILRFLP